MAAPKVILIGGAPMTGKSAAARLVAAQLGYGCTSTDDIGQAIEAVTTPQSHPALHRMVGQDYREYYVARSITQLIADAEERHAALWPALERIIVSHALWGTPLVLEGWALQPDAVARLEAGKAASVWLVAEEALLERRVWQDEFWRGASDEPVMVRRFLARSAHFNAGILEAAGRLGLPVVEVLDEEAPVELAARCLEALGAR